MAKSIWVIKNESGFAKVIDWQSRAGHLDGSYSYTECTKFDSREAARAAIRYAKSFKNCYNCSRWSQSYILRIR